MDSELSDAVGCSTVSEVVDLSTFSEFGGGSTLSDAVGCSTVSEVVDCSTLLEIGGGFILLETAVCEMLRGTFGSGLLSATSISDEDDVPPRKLWTLELSLFVLFSSDWSTGSPVWPSAAVFGELLENGVFGMVSASDSEDDSSSSFSSNLLSVAPGIVSLFIVLVSSVGSDDGSFGGSAGFCDKGASDSDSELSESLGCGAQNDMNENGGCETKTQYYI